MLTHLTAGKFYKIDITIISTLHKNNLRHREAKQLARGHISGEGRIQTQVT